MPRFHPSGFQRARAGRSMGKGHLFYNFAGIPKNLRGGIASVLFALPVIKHNYAWAGCMPAGQPLTLCVQALRR